MEGLWTIRWQPFTAGSFGGYKLDGSAPWPGEDPTPVVPCDDAAVERAARALYELDDERERVDGVEWANEPDGYRMLWREKARAVFRAAAEVE